MPDASIFRCRTVLSALNVQPVIMRRLLPALLTIALLGVGIGLRQIWKSRQRQIQNAAQADFKQTVSETLHQCCQRCHGAESQHGQLRLDSLATALKGGASGPALVPGAPNRSLMLLRAMHNDPMREVPPKDPPTEQELDVMRRWIAAGAPWPEKKKRRPEVATSERIGDAWSDPRNPIVKAFGGKRLDLWSLKPISAPAKPAVKDSQWPRNDLDYFTLAKMESAGTKPAPEAPARQLARRLYFDLTGLPPTPEQMEAYLADTRPGAYSRLVDQLLDTKAYAEHWARFWLDTVRYSDSNGFDYDEFRPEAWRYRDYVVRSFAQDKPYDRFVREQLAGDEMVNGVPMNQVDLDCLSGTGFLRVGPYDNSAARFGERDRCRAQVMADLVETTGAAFLGLNMQCCKCHDHKIDPISQQDYYRMRAFFEPSRMADEITLDVGERAAKIQQETLAIERAQQAVRDIENPAFKRLRDARRAALPEEKRKLLSLPTDSMSEFNREQVRLAKSEAEPELKDVLASLSTAEKAAHEKASKRVDELLAQRTAPQKGYVVTDSVVGPFETRVLHQGDHQKPEQKVDMGVLAILDPNPMPPASVERENSTGRRTALANWLFSADNPLTARVIVNRVWLKHFGTAIVVTPNDFGHAGSKPSHPQLLDWLAQRFRADGWSFKKLHRLIVESATYRQGLGGDAAVFAGRQPQRVTAEVLRDSLLQVAGLLKPKDGGPPVWPEIPKEVLLTSPSALFDDDTKTRGWYPSPHQETLVRSIYLVEKRSLQVPLLGAFDMPDNNASCACRTVSTVAPQALTLMNNDFMQQIVASFTKRIATEAGPAAAPQVQRSFAHALQRPPDSEEATACEEFLHQHGLTELCRSLLNLNEFVYVD